MNRPTKKTVYILIACIFSLAIISFVKDQTTKNQNLLTLETSSGTSAENIDSNQEDSSVIPSADNSGGKILVGDENLTENFSKEFFSKYYTTNGGAGLTAEDSQALTNQAVEAYKAISIENKAHFSLQDIKVVKSTDQNLKSFANTFASKEQVCITNIQKVAQATEDPIQTGNLYKKCANEFVKIPITQEINENYLNILNNLYLTGEKVYSLEAAKADPLRALVIMKEIGTLETERETLYKNISSLIIKSGIIFSNEEPGRVWLGNTQ